MRGAMLAVVSLSALSVSWTAAAQGEWDVATLMDELALPAIGEFKFEFSFHPPRRDAPQTAEQARAEIAALQPRVDAGQMLAADWARLGDLQATAGDTAAAREAREKALAAFAAEAQARPDDVALLVSWGETLLAAGLAELAESKLQQAVALDPEYLPAYSELLNVLLWVANPWIGRLQGFFHAHGDELLRIGVSDVEFADPQQREQALATVRAQAPELAAELQRILADFGSPEQVERASAAAQRSALLVERVNQVCRRRLAEAPVPEVYYAYVDAQVVHWLTSWWAQALAAGQTEETPGLQVQAFFSLLNLPDAVDMGEQVCAGLPADAQLHGTVGALQTVRIVMQVLQGMAEEEATMPTLDAAELARARAHLRQALTLPAEQRPGMAGALATLELLAGDGEAAFRVAQEAVARGEWDYGAVSMGLLGRMGLGPVELLRWEAPDFSQHPEVAETFGQWLAKLQPAEPAPWASLGAMRKDTGDWEGVLIAVRRARELAPATAKYAVAEGVALMKLGRAQEAVEVLQGAVGMAAGDGELLAQAHHAYGVALLAVGRTEEGEAELAWEEER